MDDLRYPLGRFTPPAEFTPELRASFLEQFAEAPARLREAIQGLTREQLQTPYRDGGWTVAQVVNHLADSHINSYVRFKLALTEETPQAKSYDENAWAALPDGASPDDLEVSVRLLEALHARMLAMMRAIKPGEWSRQFVMAERGARTLDLTLGIYAWHGRHHVAHITALRKRMGW